MLAILPNALEAVGAFVAVLCALFSGRTIAAVVNWRVRRAGRLHRQRQERKK